MKLSLRMDEIFTIVVLLKLYQMITREI